MWGGPDDAVSPVMHVRLADTEGDPRSLENTLQVPAWTPIRCTALGRQGACCKLPVLRISSLSLPVLLHHCCPVTLNHFLVAPYKWSGQLTGEVT